MTIGAQITKITHNSANFTLDLVMAECGTVGVKAGIDAATIVKVFNEAALGQMVSLKGAPADDLFAWRLRAALFAGIGAGTGACHRSPVPLSALCEKEMVEAMARGRPRRFDLSDTSGETRGNANAPLGARIRTGARPPRDSLSLRQ
jgi:3-hydroxyisobutyrate dehydrogenase-like beta-hydroxyacid dehydrogenase